MKISGFIEILPGLWYCKKDGSPWSTKVCYSYGNVRYDGKIKKLMSFTKSKKSKLKYHICWINKKRYAWHRLVYQFFKGSIPNNKVIDHVSGNTLDNRIINLKISSPQNNCLKSHKYKHNTSGYAGVQYNKRLKKFVSSIVFKRKHIYIGVFTNITEAYKAYYAAKIKYHGVESVSFLPKPD